MKKLPRGASGERRTNLFNNPVFEAAGPRGGRGRSRKCKSARSARRAALLLANGGDELGAVRGGVRQLFLANVQRSWHSPGNSGRGFMEQDGGGCLRRHGAAPSVAAVELGVGCILCAVKTHENPTCGRRPRRRRLSGCAGSGGSRPQGQGWALKPRQKGSVARGGAAANGHAGPKHRGWEAGTGLKQIIVKSRGWIAPLLIDCDKAGGWGHGTRPRRRVFTRPGAAQHRAAWF